MKCNQDLEVCHMKIDQNSISFPVYIFIVVLILYDISIYKNIFTYNICTVIMKYDTNAKQQVYFSNLNRLKYSNTLRVKLHGLKNERFKYF